MFQKFGSWYLPQRYRSDTRRRTKNHQSGLTPASATPLHPAPRRNNRPRFYKQTPICGVAEVIKKSADKRIRRNDAGYPCPGIRIPSPNHILHLSRLQQIHPSPLRSSLRLRQTNRCTRKPSSSSPRPSTHGLRTPILGGAEQGAKRLATTDGSTAPIQEPHPNTGTKSRHPFFPKNPSADPADRTPRNNNEKK